MTIVSEPATRAPGLAAIGAACVTVALWASAFVGIRSAGHALAPGAMALGRLSVAAAVLGLVCLGRGERFPSRDDLAAIGAPLFLCGVLWFGAYFIALNSAQRRVDAGTAAMLVNIGPILIAVLAGALLGEGFPHALFAGCGVAFAGVIVIGIASSGRAATTAGVLLCIAAAAAYSGGVVAQKVVLRRVSVLPTMFLCCLIGTVVCTPFAPQLLTELGTAPAGSIGWLVYLGVFPTAIAFTTWGYALLRTDAGRLAATTYLVPPISILLGWLWLGETPARLAYLGGALALVGVGLSRREVAARPRTASVRQALGGSRGRGVLLG